MIKIFSHKEMTNSAQQAFVPKYRHYHTHACVR